MRTLSRFSAQSSLSFTCVLVLAGALGCGSSGSTGIGERDGDGNLLDESGEPAAPKVVIGLSRTASISSVDISQGVRVKLFAGTDELPAKQVPLVAGRKGLVRAFVEVEKSQKVKGRLTLEDPEGKKLVLEAEATLGNASVNEADLSTTLNFELGEGVLPAGSLRYSIELLEEDGIPLDEQGSVKSRFPLEGGTATLQTNPVNEALKIVIVPVQYDADGSGRMPDTSPAQLKLLEETLYARYPVSKIDMSVRAPLKWSQTIGANGQGFSQVLQAMLQLRQKEKASFETYYWGMFAPSTDMQTYCRNGGCVLGLSPLAEDAQDSSFRASVGIGFGGKRGATESANTMAHEIAHAHGRNHAPCGGASGADTKFPYKTGGIGVQGYHVFTKELFSTTRYKDMMGYCTPEWVSDYTYNALFNRITSVNKYAVKAAAGIGGSNANPSAVSRIVEVGTDGALTFGQTLETTRPAGEEVGVSLELDSGATLSTTARFIRYDHLPGGFMLLPEAELLHARSLKVLRAPVAMPVIAAKSLALPRSIGTSIQVTPDFSAR